MKRLLSVSIALVVVMALVAPVFAGEPDPGVGNVNFTVMNLHETENATVQAQYISSGEGAGGAAGTVDATIPVTIDPRSSNGFPINDSGLPDNWAGSAVVSSDRPVAAFAQMMWQNDGLATSEARWKTAGAYNGFTEGAGKLFLPSLAQRTDKQFSRIAIQSADAPSTSETVDFTITFYDRDGNVSDTHDDSVNKGAQVTYDLSDTGDFDLDPAATNNWLGSAVIEADNPGDLLAASATMHWQNYSAAYSAVTGGGTEVSLPSFTRRMPGGEGTAWYQFTSVVVQNLDDTDDADVMVYWYDRDGTLLHDFEDTIPANSAHGYNTRYVDTSQIPSTEAAFAADVGYDANGSVVIESDGAEIVAVANLQWTNDHPSGAAASAYTSFADGTGTVFVPQSFRRMSGSWLQFSGLIVQNIGDSACNDFSVSWVDRATGTEKISFTDSLNPGIAHGYNTKQGASGSDIPAGVDVTDLGDDYRGTVTIIGTGCELAAIHNTVWPAWTDNTTYNAFGQ